MKQLVRASYILCLLFTVGCASTGAKSPEDKRQAVLAMKNEVLNDLYQHKPGAQAHVENAPGYAVFSNANINVVLASFGGGYGVAHDNGTGAYTYMKMGEVGVGPGFGVKDFRIIFVFNTEGSMSRFIKYGWNIGVQADAAAKAGDKGAALGGEATIENTTVYQLTESGLALQATIKGTKFWKDEDLNQPSFTPAN